MSVLTDIATVLGYVVMLFGIIIVMSFIFELIADKFWYSEEEDDEA